MTGPLHRYVAVLVALAVAVSVATWVVLPAAPRDAELVVLAVIAVVAALVPVRFVHDGHTQAFLLEGGVVVAMLLSGDGQVAPAVMMATSAVAHSIRSRDSLKTLFNAARSGVETAAAAAAFALVMPGTPQVSDPRSLLAVVAGVAALEISSLAMTTELLARLGQAARRDALGGVKGLWALNVAANTGYGIVLAAVLTVELWIALLAGVLMLMTYFGYRGYASALSSEGRARALNAMTSTLIDLPQASDGVHVALRQVLRGFGADRGVLALETRRGFEVWQRSPEACEHRVEQGRPRSGLLARAMVEGRGIVDTAAGETSAIAVPMVRGGEPVGGIAIAGRRGIEPWGPADLSLLSAVANEFAVAFDNVDLFWQVEQERARLEAESTKLNDILTAASDGIVSVLADGTIQAWNPGMARITGVEADIALGRPWHAVLRLRDTDGTDLAPTGDHLVTRVMAGRQAEAALSLQVLRGDGVWRWLQCTSSPVRHHDGRHRGVVLVARDVTTERELDELKTDFIATVSHELRTPMTPLKGFLATLRNPRTSLSDDQLASIHDAMGSQLTRLETLIADLLAVAELEHGQFELRPEPVDLSAVVATTVEVEAAGELARCDLRVGRDITALADPVAMVRVVRSLVSNALKHTRGRVEVIVRAGEDHVEVVVADEGPGIASWDQQRVFNRFERLGNHLTRTQGPGLGLTIARSLARRMGGDVTLESDVGVGAVFTLRLPRARPRAVITEAAPSA